MSYSWESHCHWGFKLRLIFLPLSSYLWKETWSLDISYLFHEAQTYLHNLGKPSLEKKIKNYK